MLPEFFRWQKIENPSLKKYLQMVDDDYDPNNDDEEEKGDGDGGTKKVMNGVLVNMCYPMTDCKAKLEENDVVLEIDGVEGLVRISDVGVAIAGYRHRGRLTTKYLSTI